MVSFRSRQLDRARKRNAGVSFLAVLVFVERTSGITGS